MSAENELQLVFSGDPRQLERVFKDVNRMLDDVARRAQLLNRDAQKGSSTGSLVPGNSQQAGRELQGVAKVLEDVSKQTQMVARELQNVTKAMGGVPKPTQQVNRELQVADRTAESFGRRMQSLGSSVATGLKMIVSALAVKQLATGIKGVMDAASGAALEVDRLTRITGLSTQRSSELRAGAQVLGVEFNTLQGAITAMLGNMKSLNAADNPFRILGIQVVDAKGQMRDFDGILADTMDKLQRMGPTGAREMFASRIFGGATPELLRMIDAGSEGIKKAAESAKAMGLVFSPAQVQAAIQYQRAVRQLGQAWEGVKVQIGNAVMPTLTNLAQGLSQWVQTGLPKLKENLEPVIQIIGRLWDVGRGLSGVVGGLFRGFLDWIGAGQRLQFMGKGIGEVFRRISTTLKDFGEWLNRLKARIQQGDIAGAMSELWEGLKQAAVDGAKIAGNFFDETLPAWGKAFGNFMEKLGGKLITDEATGASYSIGEKIGELFAKALVGIGKFLLEAIPGVVKAFSGFMTDLGAALAGVFVGFGKEMADKIVTGISPETWDAIKTSLKDWLTGQNTSLTKIGNDVAAKVVQGFKFVASNWDQILESLRTWVIGKAADLVDWGKQIRDEVSNSLKQFGVEMWEGILTSLQEWWSGQIASVQSIGTDIKDVLALRWIWEPAAWGSILSSLQTWWQGAQPSVKKIGQALAADAMDWLIGKINSAIGALNELIGLLNRLPGIDIPPIPSVSSSSPYAGGTIGQPAPPTQSSSSASGSSSPTAPAAPSRTGQPPAPGDDFLPASGPQKPSPAASTSSAKPTTTDIALNGRGIGNYIAMADGGLFRARPGGHRVNLNVAEAGKDEAVLPLDPAVFRRLGLGGGGGPVTVVVPVYLDSREIARFVKQVLMDDIKMQKQLAF